MQLINRIKDRILLDKKLAETRFYATSKSFRETAPLIISGEPRGGTTWLAEILSELPQTALLWEPLHLSYNNDFRRLDFGWRQYIPWDTDCPHVKAAFIKIFQGKTLNEWILLKTSPKIYKEASRLIIKFCRANALLPWLCNSFNFEKKPVYLIRHPFAVVASQLKQGGWDFDFTGFNIPSNGPYADYYAQYIPFLRKIATKEEGLVANWCLSNKIPLSVTPQNRKWIQVSYESMSLAPESIVRDILKEWDMPYSEAIEKRLYVKSSTTIEGSHIHDSAAQLSYWRKFFTSRQKQRMEKVLAYFEIDLYSAENVHPLDLR